MLYLLTYYVNRHLIVLVYKLTHQSQKVYTLGIINIHYFIIFVQVYLFQESFNSIKEAL